VHHGHDAAGVDTGSTCGRWPTGPRRSCIAHFQAKAPTTEYAAQGLEADYLAQTSAEVAGSRLFFVMVVGLGNGYFLEDGIRDVVVIEPPMLSVEFEDDFPTGTCTFVGARGAGPAERGAQGHRSVRQPAQPPPDRGRSQAYTSPHPGHTNDHRSRRGECAWRTSGVRSRTASMIPLGCRCWTLGNAWAWLAVSMIQSAIA
jgi:hypothetical protein